MEASRTPTSAIRFGDFELLAESGELKKAGARVRLSGQAFDTLVLLVEARGRIVSRDELQKALWSDSSFGDFEHGLNAAINRLRGALGDSATDSRYVETVPRRGYRFIHPLIEQNPATDNNGGLSATVEKVQDVSFNRTAKRGAARFIWPTVSFALLIAGAVVWIYLAHRPPSDLADIKETPLTTLPGSEISPTFSPDGSQIAFGWDGENNGAGFDLYVQAVGAENPHRLTHNVQPWLSAAWSPDGRFIAIRSDQRGSATIELVPATGG